jgi:hypothetical protein
MFIAAESLSVGRLEKRRPHHPGAKASWHPARETASWLLDHWNHSRYDGRVQTGPAPRDGQTYYGAISFPVCQFIVNGVTLTAGAGLTFFLIYLEKLGKTIR